MIKKTTYYLVCIAMLSFLAIFATAKEKSPKRELSSRDKIERQEILIFSLPISSNSSYFVCKINPQKDQSDEIVKKLGDIPIARPGTRD